MTDDILSVFVAGAAINGSVLRMAHSLALNAVIMKAIITSSRSIRSQCRSRSGAAPGMNWPVYPTSLPTGRTWHE
jgi:hypothetical protein